MDAVVKKYLSGLGKKGGAARTPTKAQAARVNIKKAIAKRWPKASAKKRAAR